MIHYQNDLHGVSAADLEGFCVGWRKPLTGERLLQVLRGSHAVVLARDDDQVVGFANALSDGLLIAYLPLLEVRPGHQRKGIGSELVRRLIEHLGGHYGIDLLCDEGLEGFYRKFGMRAVRGMCLRNLDAIP